MWSVFVPSLFWDPFLLSSSFFSLFILLLFTAWLSDLLAGLALLHPHCCGTSMSMQLLHAELLPLAHGYAQRFAAHERRLRWRRSSSPPVKNKSGSQLLFVCSLFCTALQRSDLGALFGSSDFGIIDF
jgi:hypothetical protein